MLILVSNESCFAKRPLEKVIECIKIIPDSHPETALKLTLKIKSNPSRVEAYNRFISESSAKHFI
jgi:hypothetical protein